MSYKKILQLFLLCAVFVGCRSISESDKARPEEIVRNPIIDEIATHQKFAKRLHDVDQDQQGDSWTKPPVFINVSRAERLEPI